MPKGDGTYVKFDGYDSERDVLQDAKYYRNWPLPGMKFSRDAIVGQLRSQVQAANGKAIEWIVPSQDAADRILKVFDRAEFDLSTVKFKIRVQK